VPAIRSGLRLRGRERTRRGQAGAHDVAKRPSRSERLEGEAGHERQPGVEAFLDETDLALVDDLCSRDDKAPPLTVATLDR